MRSLWAMMLFLSGCANAADDPRAVAFRDDCASNLSDLDMTRSNIILAGWAEVNEQAVPELEAVMGTAKKMGPTLVARSSFSAYRTEIGADELYLVLTRVPIAEAYAHGCYIYDFDEYEMDRSEVVERWLGQPPTEVQDYPNQIQQRKWVAPKSNPSIASVRVGVIVKNSDVANEVGFSGAIWAATAIAN